MKRILFFLITRIVAHNWAGVSELRLLHTCVDLSAGVYALIRLYVCVHALGVRGEHASKWSQRTTGIQREGDRAACEARGGSGGGWGKWWNERCGSVRRIHSYNCTYLVLYCHHLVTNGTAIAVSHLPASLKQTAFTRTKQARAASSIQARLWFEFIVWHYKLDSVEFIDFPGEATWQSAQTQSQRRSVWCQSSID